MNDSSEARPIEILLVEDDQADLLLTTEALGHSSVRNNVWPVENGEDAVAFLRRQGRFSEAVRPDLILLDLNLPRRDGREVLEEVKADADLRRIPVVVLTTSSAEEDVLRSYDLHANAYITKPVDLGDFARVVQSIDEFYFTVAAIPRS